MYSESNVRNFSTQSVTIVSMLITTPKTDISKFLLDLHFLHFYLTRIFCRIKWSPIASKFCVV